MIVMWCDKCKYSSPNPPEDVEVKIVEEPVETVSALSEVIVEKAFIENLRKQGLDPEKEIEKMKEERRRLLKKIFSELKSTYPNVVWCSKHKTFMVCNPKKPTTYIDMSKYCKDFEPKS